MPNCALKPTTNAASSSYEGDSGSDADTTQMIDDQRPENEPDTPSPDHQQPIEINSPQRPSSTGPVNGHVETAFQVVSATRSRTAVGLTASSAGTNPYRNARRRTYFGGRSALLLQLLPSNKGRRRVGIMTTQSTARAPLPGNRVVVHQEPMSGLEPNVTPLLSSSVSAPAVGPDAQAASQPCTRPSVARGAANRGSRQLFVSGSADIEAAAIVLRNRLRKKIRVATVSRTNVTLSCPFEEWFSRHQVEEVARTTYRLLIELHPCCSRRHAAEPAVPAQSLVEQLLCATPGWPLTLPRQSFVEHRTSGRTPVTDGATPRRARRSPSCGS